MGIFVEGANSDQMGCFSYLVDLQYSLPLLNLGVLFMI